MANRVDIEHSGFLSQLLYGKPRFSRRAAKFSEDFGLTVLALSDTTFDGHIKPFGKKLQTFRSSTAPNANSAHTPAFQSSQIMKESVELFGFGLKINQYIKQEVLGLSPLAGYAKAKYAGHPPNLEIKSFKALLFARDFIFIWPKLLDTLIRLPAIIAATFQLGFERAGWSLIQSDNWVASFFGYLLNAAGAIAGRFSVFAAKTLAEAIRLPFAILSGALGSVFGLITALCSITNPDFGSFGKVLRTGMADGIRPFAPEAALYLTIMNVPDAKISFTEEGTDKNNDLTIKMPWTYFISVLIAITSVLTLSFGRAGENSLIDMAVLFVSQHDLGITTFVNHLVTPLSHAFGAMWPIIAGVMLVGGITFALKGLVQGCQAFYEDIFEEHKTEKIVPVDIKSASPQLMTSSEQSRPASENSRESTLRLGNSAGLNVNNNNGIKNVNK